MFAIRPARTVAAGLSALLLALLSSPSQAQVTQRFSPWSDELPVTVANFQGKPVELKYRHCTYTATDAAGQVIRQDRCWYFTNRYDESQGLTATCDRWIYWLRLDTKEPGRDVIWARCPTTNHPLFTQMQAELLGDELWQFIPESDRQPKQSIHVLVEKFSPIVAGSSGLPPLVTPESRVTIRQPVLTTEIR